ncbi:MAG: hydroxyacylglutathione hydrolase [Gammaproteobacteria bacterium]|nr:hydroxyacylglutathione hydrolase [Gammaproteobacteria bacterium]
MIQLIPVPALRDNYIWLIRLDDTRAEGPAPAIIVDPGEAAPVLAALTAHGLRPIAILLTHHHPDHVGGVPELLRRFQVPAYGPAGLRLGPGYRPVHEGDVLSPGGLDLRVLAIPGHTLDHLAYHHDGGLLFCGDTLFTGGCGRVFEGSARQMLTALRRLAALPDATRIHCGHEYTLANLDFALQVEPENHRLAARLEETRRLRARQIATASATLEEEKATNPFLRCHLPAVRRAAERFCDRTLNTELDVFATIRRWKDMQ